MTYIDTHAADRNVRWVHLFELDLSTVQYWSDDIVAVAYNSQLWKPAVVTIDTISTEQGATGAATLTCGDADNVFSAFLFAGDITGAVVKIWQAWMDPTSPSQVPLDVRQIFLGRIVDVSLSRSGLDATVKLGLGPYADPTTKLVPTRLITDVTRA